MLPYTLSEVRDAHSTGSFYNEHGIRLRFDNLSKFRYTFAQGPALETESNDVLTTHSGAVHLNSTLLGAIQQCKNWGLLTKNGRDLG